MYIPYWDKQYKFNESSMTFEEMIKIEFKDIIDSNPSNPDALLLLALFEVVEDVP